MRSSPAAGYTLIETSAFSRSPVSDLFRLSKLSFDLTSLVSPNWSGSFPFVNPPQVARHAWTGQNLLAPLKCAVLAKIVAALIAISWRGSPRIIFQECLVNLRRITVWSISGCGDSCPTSDLRIWILPPIATCKSWNMGGDCSLQVFLP